MIGQRIMLSEIDKQKLNFMYPCRSSRSRSSRLQHTCMVIPIVLVVYQVLQMVLRGRRLEELISECFEKSYLVTTKPAENENDSGDQGGDRKVTKIELDWSSIQVFDFER